MINGVTKLIGQAVSDLSHLFKLLQNEVRAVWHDGKIVQTVHNLTHTDKAVQETTLKSTNSQDYM